MWMKYNRSMKILATVFHTHKYITNPDITPEDQVITASGKLAEELKGCMPPHLSETTLEQLERIRTILKKGWTQTVQKHPPRNPPTPPPPHSQNRTVHVPVGSPVSHKVNNPHLLFQPTKPEPLETLLISPRVTPPRVVQHPRVEHPKLVPLPRVVPPPRAAHPVTPIRSPRMTDECSEIEDEVDSPTHNTRRQKGKRRPTTQEAMLESVHVAHLHVTPEKLAQQNFMREMISAVLDEDTGELMEYRRLTKNPRYRPLYRNYYDK